MPGRATMTRARIVGSLVASLALAWAGAGSACVVSTTPLVFGGVDPLSGAPTDSAGAITVTCLEMTSYVLSISGGNGPVGGRYMSVVGGQLNYQLYTDAGLNTIWGDGTAGTVTVSGATNPLQADHTVYGRIPWQPLAKAGQYSDVVIVTITY